MATSWTVSTVKYYATLPRKKSVKLPVCGPLTLSVGRPSLCHEKEFAGWVLKIDGHNCAVSGPLHPKLFTWKTNALEVIKRLIISFRIVLKIIFKDPPHCEYSDQTGRVSPWYDRAIALDSQLSPGTTLAECRRMCDAERDFHCKSVSVSETKRTPVCLLSADDSVSFSGVNVANVLIPDREYVYSERSSCSNSKLIVNKLTLITIFSFLLNKIVKVECTKTDMVVTMAFGYPFNGRVYVNGNYQVSRNW